MAWHSETDWRVAADVTWQNVDTAQVGVASDEILVQRTAAAWLPVPVFWLDARGQLQRRNARVMR